MSDISADFIFPSGNVLVSARHPATGVIVMVPAVTREDVEYYIDVAFRILDATEPEGESDDS